MILDDSRQSQRQYKYGMILLCVGALINWLNLTENDPNAEPLRYIGFASISAGFLLICCSICCYSHSNIHNDGIEEEENAESIHVITINDTRNAEKPPEYEQVAFLSLPSYDDALKLNPTSLLPLSCKQNAVKSNDTTTSDLPTHTIIMIEQLTPNNNSESESIISKSCEDLPPPYNFSS